MVTHSEFSTWLTEVINRQVTNKFYSVWLCFCSFYRLQDSASQDLITNISEMLWGSQAYILLNTSSVGHIAPKMCYELIEQV
jgi:hypothetical protein